MDPATIIGIFVIVAILFFAIRYIYRERRKGVACIGCPFADSCPKHKPNSDTCRNKSVSSSGGC